MRAIRYEHGTIRQLTGDLRGREELSREARFDRALRCESGVEHTSQGIQYLIDTLREAKQEVVDGKVSSETLERLVQYSPNYFALPDGMEEGNQPTDRRVAVPPEYMRKLSDGIDAQLEWLPWRREKVARIEKLDLESKIKAAALPAPRVVDKLVRYGTSNERELDRALNRLDRMQERRRANEGAAPER